MVAGGLGIGENVHEAIVVTSQENAFTVAADRFDVRLVAVVRQDSGAVLALHNGASGPSAPSKAFIALSVDVRLPLFDVEV